MQRRLHLGLAFVVLAWALALVPMLAYPSGTARAQEDCIHKVVPDAMLSGLTVLSGDSGASAAFVAGSTVAAGGATAAVTLTAGTAAAVGAAFVGSVYGTCRFLDWATRDQDWLDPVAYPPITPTSTILPSSMYSCAAYGGFTTTWGTVGNQGCRTITHPAMSAAGRIYSTQDVSQTVGAVTLDKVTISAAYPETHANIWEGGNWVSDVSLACATNDGSLTNLGFGQCTGFNTWTSFVQVFHNCWRTDTGGGEFGDIGGNCGLHPRAVYYVTNGTISSVLGIWHPNPVAQSKGWSRVLMTDVQCKAGAGGATRWIRSTSASYYDLEVDARVAIPQCSSNEVPVDMLVQRVPTGVVCVTYGSVCPTYGQLLTRVTLPSALTATATAPAWLVCLTAGTDCGTPATVEGTCVWGGFTVPSTYCDPSQQTEAPTVSSGETEPVSNTYGSATSTVAAPDPAGDGGGGDDPAIAVPIDDGDGDRNGTGYTEEDTGDCWPDGWGWFNPAEWVLKPVKCALVWAFVPDGAAVSATFDDFTTALFEQFPFSLIQTSIEFLDTLGDELGSASGTGCFSGAASFSFGDFSVAPGDVCLDGLSPTSPQRATVTVLMLAPMVWALLLHAWATFLNGRPVGGD